MKQLLFILLLASMPAFATDQVCYTPSPNAVELGDDYYALDREIQLNVETESALVQTLKTLVGKWQGTLTETSCTGSDSAPKRKISYLKTTANLSINSKNELRIKARKRGYVVDIEKGETIMLFNRDGLYQFHNSDNAISSSEKIRLRANKHSRLLETISQLSLNDNTLALTIDYYSNGVYVQSMHFKLTRS